MSGSACGAGWSRSPWPRRSLAVTVLVVGLQLLLAHQSSQESLAALRGRADAAATTVRFRGGRAAGAGDAGRLARPEHLDLRRRAAGGSTAVASRRGGCAPTSPGWARRPRGRTVRRRQLPAALPAGPRPGRCTPGRSSSRRSTSRPTSPPSAAACCSASGWACWPSSGRAPRPGPPPATPCARYVGWRGAADDWREHDLSGRFELGAPRDELTELADTLDRMLDRIAQAILTERRLTDEVAHELRTPLTVIRSEAQLALLQAGPDAVPSASLDAIVAATDRMTASIETMLSLARSTHADEATCSVTRGAERRSGRTPRRVPTCGSTAEDPTPTCCSPPRCGSSPRPSYPCWTTPSGTPPRGSACTSPARRDGCCCTSRTTATGWTRRTGDRIFEPGHSHRARRRRAGPRAVPPAGALRRRRGRPA